MGNNRLKILTKGFFKENPIFVLLLGMCPTLATTTSAVNGVLTNSYKGHLLSRKRHQEGVTSTVAKLNTQIKIISD